MPRLRAIESPKANRGLWQLAQEMLPLAESLLSKNNFCPSAIWDNVNESGFRRLSGRGYKSGISFMRLAGCGLPVFHLSPVFRMQPPRKSKSSPLVIIFRPINRGAVDRRGC